MISLRSQFPWLLPTKKFLWSCSDTRIILFNTVYHPCFYYKLERTNQIIFFSDLFQVSWSHQLRYTHQANTFPFLDQYSQKATSKKFKNVIIRIVSLCNFHILLNFQATKSVLGLQISPFTPD